MIRTRLLPAAALGGASLLAGCSGPAISQINDSSLTVLKHSWNKPEEVQAEAVRGCSLYGKQPVPVSEYTIGHNDFVLFGCKGPNEVKAVGQSPAAGSSLTCYLPNGTNIQTNSEGCLKLGGGINPPAVSSGPLPAQTGAGGEPADLTVHLSPGPPPPQPPNG